MNPSLVHSSLITTLTLFSIIISIPTSTSTQLQKHENFTNCSLPFSCGNLTNISYPFYGGGRPVSCGRQGFELICPPSNSDFPEINMGFIKYDVLYINETAYSLKIAREDIKNNTCLPGNIANTEINFSLFNYSVTLDVNITLHYNCTDINKSMHNHTFNCTNTQDSYYTIEEIKASIASSMLGDGRQDGDSPKCDKAITVPVLTEFAEGLKRGTVALEEALRYGFFVEYKQFESECRDCQNSTGVCGSDPETQGFRCFCGNEVKNHTCHDGQGGGINWTAKIIIAVCAAIVGIGLAGVLFFFLFRRYRRKFDPSLISRGLSFDLSKADAEQEIYMGLYVFCYDELEKATNNFDDSKQLGDGGFGTVYYGELKDGRAVAVKRLFDNNYKRVEQFMNEIDILARLRHKNLVTLYGCTSRRSRELLLVYEYVPNGTVADHLHGDKAKPGAVPWSTRLNIAIETASALTFLHASDIIHRDVKTTNILLDANFCVKVGDFGLSRLFPTHVTHISTAPQGTPGYVDPEYHQCYQLTDKSDVYSFGVVLIELISSKPAVDITRHRHEVNLSNMAINKIRNNSIHELVDPNLGYESDQEVKRMINCVAELAFRCLQYGNDMRPSMAEVSDILNAIQNEKHGIEKSEKPGIAADDAVLPKRDPVPLSPNSVTDRWTSTSTTPNVSSSKSS